MHAGLMVTSAVATLLRALQKRFEDGDAYGGFVDYVVESDTGKPIALYFVDTPPDVATTAEIRRTLTGRPGTLSAYYCISTAVPSPNDAEGFAAALGPSGTPARLVPIAELPALLGQDDPLEAPFAVAGRGPLAV